jgi:predicted ATPase
VVYIEGLHRADNALLDLMTTLISEGDSLSVLIVVTARPVFFERHPSWSLGQKNHTRLDIRLLDKGDRRSLIERSEGNPYYIEEVVKMQMDNRKDPPSWHLHARFNADSFRYPVWHPRLRA